MSNADITAGSKRQARGSRRVSRELALQALYQWLLSGDEMRALLAQAEEKDQYARADAAMLRALVAGVIEHRGQLEDGVQPFLDRPLDQLSPIERALLLMAAYELVFALDVPYRVVINEAVELAKTYGGTDGHKYVNGVLDKLAAQTRPAEVKKQR
jgi:N utilization substance protein B